MRFHFGEFCLDTERRELSVEGLPVHLTPKALDLLRLLIQQRPKVLKKEEIYEELWPDTFVEESSLSVVMSELRAALRDEARAPRFVKTAHGYGYGFIAAVREEEARPAASMVRLRWGMQEFDLAEGDNMVGRDVDARIRLNAPGISRHHARISVTDGGVAIEDLGSKNGTYVQGRRIDGVQELHDGDEIRLSRELLVVVKPDPVRSTVTDIS